MTKDKLAMVRRLRDLARARGQSIAQMAISWVLRHPGMTSALIGASRPDHIQELACAHEKSGFSEAELNEIDRILKA